MTDSSIVARAQQIVQQATGTMYWADAIKQAITEKVGNDPAALLDYAAGAFMGAAKKIQETQYDLPNDPTLFDLREHIYIDTKDGPLGIHREDALPPEVKQWIKGGKRKHSAQLRRFERIEEMFEAIEAKMDPERPYMEQLREIEGRRSDDDAA